MAGTNKSGNRDDEAQPQLDSGGNFPHLLVPKGLDIEGVVADGPVSVISRQVTTR